MILGHIPCAAYAPKLLLTNCPKCKQSRAAICCTYTMIPKSYSLDFEPGEQVENKKILNPLPCAAQIKILDQFSPDNSGNNLIEYRRMQMTLVKQKEEIDKLKQQHEWYEMENSTLKRDIDSLQAQLQEQRSSSHSQIMELEDKVASLLAKNRQLRAEIALCESSDASDAGQVALPKKTVLPSRWTRSQPNLKETPKQTIYSLDNSLSDDTIDLLTSQVSELGFAKDAPESATPNDISLRILQIKKPELIKEPATLVPYSSLDGQVLATPPKCTPRESLFTENFSLDNALCSIAEESANSRGTLNVATKNPVPTFESTFIGDAATSKPTTITSKPKLHIAKAFKSHPNMKMVMASEKSKQNNIPKPSNIYQMVSQVFLGEMLHKSTRGFRKIELHQRYFWVHPYTLTLYWGKEGPSNGVAGKAPKSLAILGVNEEDNLNATPDLFEKSIVITSGKRDIKLTCSDSTQHDVWIKSLQHLLAGTGAKQV